MRIVVRFSPRALAGGNHGIDEAKSAARYAELLREAVARDFAGAAIDVASQAGPSVEVRVHDV